MIYVGIDLHRKWSQLAALDAAGEPRLSRRIPSRPEEFFRVFGELVRSRWKSPSRRRSAAAGSSTFWPTLASQRTWPTPWLPRRSPSAASGTTRSTPARSHTCSEPTCCRRPGSGLHVHSDLVRTRASLVRLSSRLKCQIHALLADYGVNPELTDVFAGRVAESWQSSGCQRFRNTGSRSTCG